MTSRELHRDGIEAALRRVGPGANVVVSIDCDGIDPAAFPAVAMPTPGGLTYEDVVDLLHGVAGKARIANVAIALALEGTA